ncbi:MAG TPA: hypothetical protein VG222_02995 [Vicinamibacterales bacterium]|nr:hypothetical protein [Vicinamibacterales bacterium]
MTAAYDQSIRSGDVFLESDVATNLALQRFLVNDRAGGRALTGVSSSN